jgi:RNA recognition motif-containing protein
MGAKLYVGNLAYAVTDDRLQQHFAQHGSVVSARVITDKFSGRSKGFGFVEMASEAEAEKAMNVLNGTDFKAHCRQRRVPVPSERRGGYPQGGQPPRRDRDRY